VPAVVADCYGVLVDAQFADEARRVLALTPVAPAERRDHPI